VDVDIRQMQIALDFAAHRQSVHGDVLVVAPQQKMDPKMRNRSASTRKSRR